ncbi:MAG TPA: CAP domain-containing protein [Planctomycetota bacterium]|nr:CAP domain-containing protein [Planctomycetota bacterium]
MARLRIEFRGAETLVSLARGETTVGRSNTCTIHLPDPQLAPVHFRIRPKGDGFQLKDDGSGSGTRVNGKPVFAVTLRHGDRIEAGGLSCLFLAEADRAVPAAAPPPPEPPEMAAPAGHARRWWILAVAGAVVAIGVVVFLDRRAKAEEARAMWQAAGVALEAARTAPDEAEARLGEAIALLERLQQEHAGSRYAAIVPSRTSDARRALSDLARVAELKRRIRETITEEESDEILRSLAELRGAHDAVVARAHGVEEALRNAKTARVEHRFAKAEEEAKAHLAARRFGEALRVWREFPDVEYVYRERAERARADVARRVAEEYRGLLKLAGASDDLDAKIDLLEASRPVFVGTTQAEDLEVRIAALRARRASALLTAKAPEATKPPKEGEPASPAEPAAYEEPPGVRDLIRERRYGEAAALLASISRHPLARVEAEELTLLANLMADLVAAVRARPTEFTDILLPEGRADVVAADAAGLRASKAGAEVTCTWGALPPKSFVRLFKLAKLDDPPRLATALFFDNEDQPKEAEAAYAAFFKSGGDQALLARVVARRRGIPEPAEGFRLFRGRLVTVGEEKAILEREEIDRLAKQARSTVDARRREAFDALERMGAPATEALALALKERRAAVADALAHEKAFSPSRFVSVLGSDLREARQAALDFILSGTRYPYPAVSEEPQKEAERLVGAVREICETPYPRLLAKSDEATALDAELKELDARLARADPLAEPLYEATVERIQKAIDGAKIPLDDRDRKRLDFNDAVAKYNREVKTTADDEERANVEAVNEYRSLMGLEAVKIDERLVRGARKHSIEMRQRDYFAHDSPTPQLRTPNQRAQREGYAGGVWENIALGAADGRAAFWQWYRSSGHHRNMLQPGHTEMGCGSEKHHWWTQMFGSLTGRSLDPPRVPLDPDPPGQSGNGDPAQ